MNLNTDFRSLTLRVHFSIELQVDAIGSSWTRWLKNNELYYRYFLFEYI